MRKNVVARRFTPALVLIGIVAAGAGLRFWNVSAGISHRMGVDEPLIAERAIAIMNSGDFNPHFFDYGGLYIYWQFAIACTRFIVGATSGLWGSLEEFGPEHLFLWTRAANAALGTATILLLYLAGLRWGTWPALMGAAVLAVFPNHVRESHFALTDVPLAFMVTLTFLLALRAHERQTLWTFAAAGAAAGFATAIKYNGAVALVMPVTAALLAPGLRPHRLVGVLVAAGACGGPSFWVRHTRCSTFRPSSRRMRISVQRTGPEALAQERGSTCSTCGWPWVGLVSA